MKKAISCTLLFCASIAVSQAQTIQNAKLVRAFREVKDESGAVLKLKRVYDIDCTFDTEVNVQSFRSGDMWAVTDGVRNYRIDEIAISPLNATVVKLKGNWGRHSENLIVACQGQKAMPVDMSKAGEETARWGFGEGKAVQMNLNRIADQKSLFAFDYDLNTRMIEFGFLASPEKFWLNSISLDVNSSGTFGNDDEVRNGTQSSLGFGANAFFFIGGIIYGGKLSLAYQMETRTNSDEDKLIDITNKSLKIGAQIEVPYSNYPIYKLHSKTGYVRLAMPLTLIAEYLPKGEDETGNTTSARFDFQARYELAFSPYLIIQGEWHGSRFFDVAEGFDKTASYYSVAVAQDLDIVKTQMPFAFLKPILGSDEEIRGRHFVYYRISSGRKEPAFQDLREQSFGFGTYF